MSDDATEVDDFWWDLQSSKVRSEDKIPVPEDFREYVVMDSGEGKSTWWCYDKEGEFGFLSSSYINSDRFTTVNNQSYKLEKGSGVIIPQLKDNFKKIIEGGVLDESPEKDDKVYFYTDSRMKSGDPQTALVLTEYQFRSVIANPRIAFNIREDENQDSRGGGAVFSLSGDGSDLPADLKLYILSTSVDELIERMRDSEEVDRGLMRSISVPE